MFQFSAFAYRQAVWHAFSMPGCPIRKSTDRIAFADTRGLSQLITSFIASGSLGIPRVPLFTFSSAYAFCPYADAYDSQCQIALTAYAVLFLFFFSLYQ